MKPLSIALFICGIMHLLPVAGLLGSTWLQKLYGVEHMSQNLTLLMQHRALMFGLLGGLFIYAAWRPSIQLFAFVTAIISMLGFVILVGFNNPEPRLHKVVLIDCGALLLLISALMFAWLKSSH